MLKSLHSLGSCAETFPLIQISSILSVIFTRLWLKCQSVLMGQLHLSKACWELWLSDDQPHSDYNGQWQRALCILAVLQSSQPNPQRNEKNRKMYAIKQIKICAEYQDMLPRPRLDLSGTPGLRPIGLSPGSWQTSLGLGSMSRYSAQILICITQYDIALYYYLWKTDHRRVSLVFADVLVPIWHQDISNHHVEMKCLVSTQFIWMTQLRCSFVVCFSVTQKKHSK